MGRTKTNLNAELAKKAEEELKSMKDSDVCIRLQGIISSMNHPLKVVSEVLGVGRKTLHNWIIRFREKGVEGLVNKPKGHNPSKLKAAQRLKVKQWLERSTDSKGHEVHWTLQRLSSEIHMVWGINITINPLWKMIREMGFVQKKPRPRHIQADLERQDDFKKNSRNN